MRSVLMLLGYRRSVTRNVAAMGAPETRQDGGAFAPIGLTVDDHALFALKADSSARLETNATLTLASYATLTLIHSTLTLINSTMTLGANASVTLINARVRLANSSMAVAEGSTLYWNASDVNISDAFDACTDLRGCTTPPAMSMNLTSLTHWFTATGVIAGLVAVMWCMNLYAFHRHEFLQTVKRHFKHVTPTRMRRGRSSKGTPEQSSSEGRDIYAHPVHMLGKYLRRDEEYV